MEETLLNQETTRMATSNPQANVNQINNNQVVQPIQSNVNTANVNQNNEIKPITIPIQIQPQVTPTGQSNTNQNMQPSSNLQTIGNSQTPQTYNAPTPQTYQGNTSNNVVDFNKIYNSYNQTSGNNSNFTNSGVKKTTYNTTIVTPTVSNLNTVEGQYQSAYADTVNGLIGEMLKQMQNGFYYDPSQDASLRLATEYAANSTLQSLAGSGVLNSSATSERVARIVSELIPQYEEKAHDRWIEYLGQLADTAQLVMNYDAQQFEYWKDAKDREFQNKQFEYQKQQDALENAWKRVDELGYVDNEASKVLGVKVGTLSGAAREAKEQREFELYKMKEQLEIQRANDEALARLKSELDLQSSKALAEYENKLNLQRSKELASYESQLNREERENEYKLQKQYATTNNNSSSSTIDLNTHDEIIKNRWASYDDFSKKYTITDKNAAYNYLKNQYASGRISLNDVYTLMYKYGINESSTNTNNSNNSNTKKRNLLDSLNDINKQIINGSRNK